jgi:hypothetical protein
MLSPGLRSDVVMSRRYPGGGSSKRGDRRISPTDRGYPAGMEIIAILILIGVVAFVIFTKRDKKRKV